MSSSSWLTPIRNRHMRSRSTNRLREAICAPRTRQIIDTQPRYIIDPSTTLIGITGVPERYVKQIDLVWSQWIELESRPYLICSCRASIASIAPMFA